MADIRNFISCNLEETRSLPQQIRANRAEMMKYIYSLLAILLLIIPSRGFPQADTITIVPSNYERALRNPMKGFSPNNLKSHPWGTLSTFKFPWTTLENDVSDGIDKIIAASNEMWGDAAAKNMKVIPHIYLHWNDDKKYWPADMQEDDYTSEQFQERVVRLIKRLGICWDNDPRIAFIEMAIFGKWGEQHSPSPTPEMQKIVGDAFAEAFKNKKVSVRHNWKEFTDHPFGEYWASWAHYDQMYGHGNSINNVNKSDDRYKVNYLGGEVAYNWGNWEIQPGATPTESLADPHHRDFVINSIRWLHCTHLRWIDNYDQNNPLAVAGAEEMQKAFGYRYELNQVRYSIGDSLHVSFDVTNTGSAPFYYNWPVEVALLDPATLQPVWKSAFDSQDIRKWLPGEEWSDPEWTPTGDWRQYVPNVDWNSSGEIGWSVPPATNRVEEQFKVDVPDGTYVLSLAILDPAGNVPAIRFATANYINGGRHPMGLVTIGENTCSPLPVDFQFDDPYYDNSLTYDDDFEIVYTPDPEQKPYEGSAWRIPEDTVAAWQYDYMFYKEGDKYFSLDEDNTIMVYGCNDTTGYNIRSYQDSVLSDDAAQFLWDTTTGTFRKHGQWVEYSVNFMINQPYQLKLRARTGKNAHFRLKIYTELGDTIFSRDVSLENDFENPGGGNEDTDWLLSDFAIPDIWGHHIVRFDWYDHTGEPGIFGGFSFTGSNLDVTPPEWYFISLGTFPVGTDIEVGIQEAATVYMVPKGTAGDSSSIYAAAVAEIKLTANTLGYISTDSLEGGIYILYAIDLAGNISDASREITLEKKEDPQVNAAAINITDPIAFRYDPVDKSILIVANKNLEHIIVYDVLGNMHLDKQLNGREFQYPFNSAPAGIYLARILDVEGNSNTIRFMSN